MSIRGSNKVKAAALDDDIDGMERMSLRSIRAVPEKPTMEMLAAGSRAGGIAVETAWDIYRAMLKAAP